MKSIALFSTILFSFNLFAAKLECSQNTPYETQGMYVTAVAEGDIEVISKNEISLNNFSTKYTIFADIGADEEIWSKGSFNAESLSNNITYNPRRYKNHFKYNISLYATAGPDGGYGVLDLIIPAKNLLSSTVGDSFEAYLIMTWMDDHFGGTVKLNCTIQ